MIGSYTMNFISIKLMEFIMEGLNFSLNFCRVYHTSGTLGHVYGRAHQLEAIVETFETPSPPEILLNK